MSVKRFLGISIGLWWFWWGAICGVQAQPVSEEHVIERQDSTATSVQGFPIHLVPVDGTATDIRMERRDDGRFCLTLLGRMYVWWEVKGALLELQADNLVVFLSQAVQSGSEQLSQIGSFAEAVDSGLIEGIYLSGDVVLSEGVRSIRCHEMFFDVNRHSALAVNAVMRTYDTQRKIPIYVRAAKLKIVAQNVFKADQVVLTTSEFYVPQVSLTAAKVMITDTTAVDAIEATRSDQSFDAQMEDVRFKVYDQTVLQLPKMRSDLQRPDVPLKGVSVGNSDLWGTSVETRWYLSRLLGLREPEDTEATLFLDYFDKRGPGTGLDIDYVGEDYFGQIQGYLINDHGEDRLGRISTRRNLAVPDNLRGRFKIQHRQFLPYRWQVTTELSYLSDRNYLEQFNRTEFDTDKPQETLLNVKRVEDNWGLGLTGKARINDFTSEAEELPTAELHWTGESLFDDRLTFYSDTRMGRYRYRFDPMVTPPGTTDFFTLGVTRNELDLPLRVQRSKLVPFVATTVGYEDGDGFTTDIQGTTVASKEAIWFAESGVRFFPDSIWRVYPEIRSRLWDLNQIRHIIEPSVTAVSYWEDEAVAQQRDVLDLGLTQRWQTKRGLGNKQRVVDWLRVNLDLVWVNEAADYGDGPSYLLWNRPLVPLEDAFSGMVPPRDRRRGQFYGPNRNYGSTDFVWRLSDSTVIIGDCYYDMQAGVVRQTQFGVSHLRWPDLSLYIGSRYLRDSLSVTGQHGTHALTFAALYKLDPRYAMVVSEQYDTDYGASIRSEVTLLRRYHRLNYGFTFSVDESLDSTSVVFSLWPQGVEELAFGLGRYEGLGL